MIVDGFLFGLGFVAAAWAVVGVFLICFTIVAAVRSFLDWLTGAPK